MTDTAPNGRAALEKLAGRAYDLILTDLKMPEVDGPAFYRILETRDPRLARRVVFLTGDTMGPDAAGFLREVDRPCLTKPFNLDDVVRVVRQVLHTP